MTENYARTLKRRTLIALVATLISMALLIGAMFWMWCSLFGPPEFMRKDNPSLTPQSAQVQLDTGATAYWQEASYSVPADSALADLLHTELWVPSSAFQTDKADLVLRFGELYKLYLWSDGRASFYDGYSGRGTKSHAYYTIPNGVVKDLTTALTTLSF